MRPSLSAAALNIFLIAAVRGESQPATRCPPDAPLGGHIVQKTRARTASLDCRGTGEIWFNLLPPPGLRWPMALYPAQKPTEITYRIRIEGCSPMPSFGQVCTAPPASVSGTARGPLDSLGLYFYATYPELSFEVLPEEIREGALSSGLCRNADGSNAGPDGWRLGFGGVISPDEAAEAAALGVRPTACYGATDPTRERDCQASPERYAVIPFRGEGTVQYVDTATSSSEVETRWEVCCGCGRPVLDAPAVPSEADPDPDPCANSPCRERCQKNTAGVPYFYMKDPNGIAGKIRRQPGPDSPVLHSPPNGTRLMHQPRQGVKKVAGQSWYYVTIPGREGGWVSERDFACARPAAFVPPPVIRTLDTEPRAERPVAPQGGARG